MLKLNYTNNIINAVVTINLILLQHVNKFFIQVYNSYYNIRTLYQMEMLKDILDKFLYCICYIAPDSLN